MSPTPTPTQTPNPSDLGGALIPHLSSDQATVLIAALVIAAYIAVLTPWRFRTQIAAKVPFITWFLLHWGVAISALLVLAILAVAGLLSSPLIALFASVFGYVLGSNSSKPTASTDGSAGKQLSVNRILPPRAPAGSTIAIVGQAFDPGVAVTFGDLAMTEIVVSTDGSMLSGRLPAAAGAGKVAVVVKNPNGYSQTISSGFEFVV